MNSGKNPKKGLTSHAVFDIIVKPSKNGVKKVLTGRERCDKMISTVVERNRKNA